MAQIISYIKQLLQSFPREILIFDALFLGAVISLKLVEVLILARIKKLTKKTSSKIDDILIRVLNSIGLPFYFTFGLFVASRFIEFHEKIEFYCYYLFLIVVVYYIVKAIQSIINYWSDNILENIKEEKKSSLDPSAVNFIRKILVGIVWGVAIIVLFQNLGYNVSALVAGLGVGGLAIAFALQNVLGDFFAAFSIYFDKPFETGDYIIVGDDGGTVRRIGIKTTRIETLRGEELVMSNKKLTNTKIHNFKKMQKRRITFNLGIIYGTSNEKLKKVKEIIKETLQGIDKAEVDRVNFIEFGDSSLKFEAIYYLFSKEYAVYVKIQEKINFEIKKRFEEEGIELAFPTQTINIKKSD